MKRLVFAAVAAVACACARAETALYEQLVNDGYTVTATADWGGGRKLAFTFGGRAAAIVEPAAPRAEKPWVWSLYSFDAATTRRTGADYLVQDGFYNAYLNIDDTYGDDTGIAALDAFYTYLTGTLGLAGTPGMIGCSWGAFYAVRYAATYTANVSKLLLFSPVLSFTNFQGEIGSYWTSTASGSWSTDSRMPVQMAGALKNASIPVTMYVGGEDMVAPDADNGYLFSARYANGTLCKKNVRTNCAHEPFGLEADEVSAAVEFFGATIRQRIYVKQDATGAGDGSSWADAAKTVADAIALMTPGAEVEIWIAGDIKRIDFDLTIELTKGISIRGGFAGTETALSQRAVGSRSNWDGENLVDFIKFTSIYDPSLSWKRLGVDILVDRIVFRRAHARAITRNDCAGALTLQDCVFEDNGGTVTCTSGHALQITGQSGNPHKSYLTISNCVFRGNVGRTAGNTPAGLGGAIRASYLERFTLDDSSFVSNGVPYSIASKGHGTGDYYNGGLSGAAIGATAAPLVARNCTFIGNTARVTGSAGAGGTVNLDGACGGSAFTNCLFLANQDGFIAWNGFNGGALLVNAATADAKVTVSGSTIAYNLSDGPQAAAGLTVVKGAVEVVDSVVAGNVRRPDSIGGAEIATGENGSVAVRFSMLPGRSAEYVSGNVTFGDGALFGDPMFVTTPSMIESRYTKTANRVYWTVDDDANFAAVCASDMHLSSGSSAVDGADPASPYAKEPVPNGARRDMGFYGNTSGATPSSPTAPEVASMTIDFPKGLTKPEVTVTLVANGAYNGIVTVYSGTGDVAKYGYQFTNVVYGVKPGDTITVSPGVYLDPGDTYSVAVSAWVAGQTSGAASGFKVVTGEKPYWIDHGGDPEKVVHLRAGADGKQDGTSWTDAFADVKSALAAVSGTKEELWIAGDFTVDSTASALTLRRSFTFRGGFRGDEDAITDRREGAVSALDGNFTFDLIAVVNGAGCDVTVERLKFRRALTHGFSKTGAGDIAFYDCIFENNAKNQYQGICGLGLSLTGASAARATVSNCVFAGNAIVNEMWSGGLIKGAGLYAYDFARVTVDDSTFVTNGVPFDYPNTNPAREAGVRGMAIYAEKAPITILNSEFRANRGVEQYGEGGTVRLEGASGGSSLENCLFVGNEELRGNNSNGKLGGALLVNLDAKVSEVSVDKCTFAYNLMDGASGTAGINVNKGTLVLRNSILYGNHILSGAVGADMTVSGAAALDMAYCWVTAKALSSVSGVELGELVGVSAGDPLFVTPLADTQALVRNELDGNKNIKFWGYGVDGLADVLAFDVHLRSSLGYWLNDGTYVDDDTALSAALDAGDPLADYSNELTPNGKRLNLGCYANTPEASHSESAEATIEKVEVKFLSEWTQPSVIVTLGGAPGAIYNATVTFMLGTNTYDTVSVASGVGNGQTVTNTPSVYYLPGDPLCLKVIVSVSGFDPIEQMVDTIVDPTKKFPPWSGHGGPANVIHVRAGADALKTGENWLDAYPDLASAVGSLGNGKDEIWIAGDMKLVRDLPDLTPTTDIVIRGGFTGIEDSLAQRPETGLATVDGVNAYNAICLKDSTKKKVTVERILFRQAYRRAISKSGRGDLLVYDCIFADNGTNSEAQVNSPGGRGIYFDQSGYVAESTLVISNCAFRGNLGRITSGSAAMGTAVCGSVLKAMIVDDSLFVSNGVPYTLGATGHGSGEGYNGFSGSAIYAYKCPTVIRNSAFIGNNCRIGGNTGDGGAVAIAGSSSGSALTNCLFSANQNFFIAWNGYNGGALQINMANASDKVSVSGCTFAYNLSQSTTGPAGLTVSKGDVTVTDSIFYGNLRRNDATGGADLSTADSDATVTLRYSMLTALDETSYSGNVTPVEGVFAGNPKFVTPLGTVTNLVVWTSSNPKRAYWTMTDEAYDAACSFDLHLKYRSKAVDKADPEAPYGLEPSPNGHRRNLGYYGNTSEATISTGGFAIIVR